MFKFIKMAPADPILGLSEIYDNDVREDKINLGIGVYIHKNNNAPILNSVKKAEEWLLKHETSKNYLNIEGMQTFNTATQDLLFQDIHHQVIVPKQYMNTVQTPGGTGALRIAAEFIISNTNTKRIWISSPSWINHKNIFLAAGLEIHTYPYYDDITDTLNFDELYSSLKNIQSNDIVLFHGCCHNPTGIDLNAEQWEIISDLSIKNKWLPLFDIAYQGFSCGIKEDLKGLYIFCKKNIELIVCNSYSKNFGLYNERIGACTIVTNNTKKTTHILSQLRAIIRANYSNPPAHGASIVSLILNNKILKYEWETELNNMRMHINNIRKLFFYTLQKNNNNKKDFSFINNQTGMFAYLNLNTDQVIKLRKEFGIYLVGSGRINLAGITNENVNRVCQSIINVL
ncbi:amino acid aminotransferase [Candidatus Blochmannia ocreatus (nom. nud.)]|uniref:Aminotransferase n=1 Tax=Candidatus Blochmannia ocreatus (nom. nud.) TaxID=251538 RepID=A0ABY4SSF5_9ENTR|nr:amino acid aminotransferase [Candidatus Blochmannia ocreatus]URJ24920.1 aspartate/tyrosine/aromatic aminotransferase [Candidatus Blochmannia ocreatus]